jgi:hypothetical protein
MFQIDYTVVLTFVAIIVGSFLVLLNLQLDESINDRWSKFGISFVLALCFAGGVYFYNMAVADELMTTNFAFDEVKLPDPDHLIVS